MTAQVGDDHPVVLGEVAQLVRPQRPAQHEPVEKHDGRPLAALDDVDAPAVVDVDDVLHAVVGHGEPFRRDVVGGRACARHEPVLGRPAHRQRGAGTGGRAAAPAGS